jgi:hypothetical protein
VTVVNQVGGVPTGSQAPSASPTQPSTTRRRRTASEPEPEPEAEPAAAPEPTTVPQTQTGGQGKSYTRTVWWPGCGCGPVDYSTQFKSQESCEASSCKSLAQMDSEVHQRQAKVQRHQPGGVSGSSMMSQGSDREEDDQPLVESAAPQDEL